MSKAIVKTPARTVAKLRSSALLEILERVAKHDAEIVAAANKAAELDSVEHGQDLLKLDHQGQQKAGFNTARELRIAIDAKKNGKEAPVYLKMANERSLLRWRDGSGESPKNTKPSMVVLPITLQPATPAHPAGRIIIDGKAVDK